jgi:membrane protein YdbS with pleckstrin-like domain
MLFATHGNPHEYRYGIDDIVIISDLFSNGVRLPLRVRFVFGIIAILLMLLPPVYLPIFKIAMNFYVALLLLSIPISMFVIPYLSYLNFHILFFDKYFVVKEGIIKRTEKHIPYNKIQHVTVERLYFDAEKHNTSVTVETAALSGGHQGDRAQEVKGFGLVQNAVIIPGLHPYDAEQLKQAFIEKMHEFAEPSVSGI